MKIKYLGTAAAEGIPAIFCECDTCREARRRGGRNIRTRSQSIIDDRLLIDFPADTYLHFLQHNIPLPAITACLITHSHSDHLYTPDISMRKPGYAYGSAEKDPMVFYSDKSAYDEICAEIKKEHLDKKTVRAELIQPYVPFTALDYTVTALRANHSPATTPVIYIIEKDGKCMLYAHDTGIFPDETWEYLEKTGKRFDFISLDCNEADKHIFYNTHMCLEKVLAVRERLYKINAADGNTVIVLNHFSHNGGNVLYEEFSDIAARHGFIVSYDGLEMEF